MIIYGNSPEEKEKSNTLVYIKCIFAGIVVTGVLILSGIGVKYMVLLLIKYWYFLAFGIAIIFVFRYAVKRFKRKHNMQSYPPQYYNQ